MSVSCCPSVLAANPSGTFELCPKHRVVEYFRARGFQTACLIETKQNGMKSILGRLDYKTPLEFDL